MQGLRVVVDARIAGLRSTPENSAGTGPTKRARLGNNQLNSAASLRMNEMQASICAISIYSSG
jgi:hypothetical protein